MESSGSIGLYIFTCIIIIAGTLAMVGLYHESREDIPEHYLYEFCNTNSENINLDIKYFNNKVYCRADDNNYVELTEFMARNKNEN